MSVEARDRKIENWYNKIRYGEVKLPRFQRYEAWDQNRICSLLSTIIHGLPLGITLILEVDEEPFISRYIKTAEIKNPPFPKVNEHLLDGQQRLTALWRTFHNNYEHTKYFIYIKEYDETWDADYLKDEVSEYGNTVMYQNRWKQQKSGKLMPLWADDPAQSFKRGCIPTELLRPEDISKEINNWIDAALLDKKPASGSENFEEKFLVYIEKKQKLLDQINTLREVTKHYNLPFLALPSSTSKTTALDVFINMNTNSKPLTQYDIIVAEIEGLKDTSLHDLQEELNQRHPSISRYFNLSYLILYTSALMQGKIPNQRGIWEMDKKGVVDNWDLMVSGLSRMANFLEENKIFDEERLPTNAVLAVIAALYTKAPVSGDQAGKFGLLIKKYLWSSFFTDRYENSAASRAYADFTGMVKYLFGDPTSKGIELSEIPIFDRKQFPLSTKDELLEVNWPKRVSIRGRGILAVANYFGSLDFADGSVISSTNVSKREYHHIFPDALITEANNHLDKKINSTIALNCALITGTTNRKIGKKDPLSYLKDRYNWVSEHIIAQRLNSHLIPVNELKAGTYEGLTEKEKAKKVEKDYQKFIAKRAELIIKAVNKLVEGEEVYASEII